MGNEFRAWDFASHMPWNTQSGGNGQVPRGPWGRGPSSGGRMRPPKLDDLLRGAGKRLRQYMPGGALTAGGIALVLLGVIAVWPLSGIYFVTAREEGVVLRFGKYVARTPPGINYHWPWPIETVETPEVTTVNQITVGYRVGAEANDESELEDAREESLMLTGDENIVDVNFTVGWVIKDPAEYLFDVDNPPQTIKAVAESAMREVVGQTQIEPILTQDRAPIENQVRDLMQKTLDSYRAGVTITQVKMQKADTPAEVIDAYRDVQAARADQERMRNEGEAYANKIIPEARGKAAKVVQDAEAYRQQVIAEAEGEAKRFLSVYAEYKKAPEVTRRRMYLETMSAILAPMNKVIVDEGASRGVVPYLPLPGLDKRTPGGTVTEPGAPPAGIPQMSSAPSDRGAQQ
ncbi:MAG TPA: FtsH protease activity modulator HflK [Rhizomicrobium sp.]|nr:FtsH protease activity modulator HflK [Rhizomicrobium sp.]